MTRIGRNPGLRRLPLAFIVSAGGAVLIGLQMPRLFDSPSAVPIGIAVSFVFLIVLIFCVAVLPYRQLSWDERAGTATFGRRTVPLSSVTRAVRSVSQSSGSISIVYRFFSTEGPSVRVLVAGRPMTGIDQDALAELRRFIEAVPIADPPQKDGLTDEQSTVADAISDLEGSSDVGKRLLLEELDGALGPEEQPDGGATAPGTRTPLDPLAPPPPARESDVPTRPSLSSEEAAALAEQWERDDRDAAACIAENRVSAATVRRVFFWATVLAAIAAAAGIAFGVVLETIDGWIDSDTNDVISLTVAGSAVVGVLSYFGWCAAADAHVRRRQALARLWLESRGPEQRTRGLAPQLLEPWAEPAPGTRLIRALAYVGSTLGGLGLLVPLAVVLADDDDLTPIAILVTALIGAVMMGLSIVGFVRTARARRESRRQFVLLAGWRLFPPDVEVAQDADR